MYLAVTAEPLRPVDQKGANRQFGIIGRKRVQIMGSGRALLLEAVMDRVRTLTDAGRRFNGGVRYLGQGRTSAAGEAVKASKSWYNSTRWRKLRMAVLAQAAFQCRYCGAVHSDTSQLVADHIRAHRESPRLFWDEGNLQCLCASCHSGTKQAEEAGGR